MDEIRKSRTTDWTHHIQGPLALIAAGLDIHEPDKVKRREAMAEWIKGDGELFRIYAEKHSGELTRKPEDFEDAKLLQQLLNKVRAKH